MTAIAGRPVVVRITRRHVAVWTIAAVVLAGGTWRLAGRDDAARGDEAGRVSATALATFTAGVERLGAEGGQIVVDGMKPGVADISEGVLPDEVLARMARGWVASMREVRAELIALDAPGPLAAVAASFERALTAYVRTGEVLIAAATASGERRTELLDEAMALGSDADLLYDDALRALEAVEVSS